MEISTVPLTATIIARSRPMTLRKDGTRDPFISMLLNIQKDPIWVSVERIDSSLFYLSSSVSD
jgi:hypothetical protein